MRRPSDPYLAIIWAARHDTGLHLTAAEVLKLACDDAVLTAAEWKAETLVACTDKPNCPCYCCRRREEPLGEAALRVYEMHRRAKH